MADLIDPKTLKEMHLIRRDARIILLATIASFGLLGVALWAACLLRLRDWHRVRQRDPQLKAMMADPATRNVDVARFKRSRIFLLIGLLTSLAICVGGTIYLFSNPLGPGR